MAGTETDTLRRAAVTPLLVLRKSEANLCAHPCTHACMRGIAWTQRAARAKCSQHEPRRPNERAGHRCFGSHLANGEVHRDEVFALVNGRDVRARVLFADDGDAVRVPARTHATRRARTLLSSPHKAPPCGPMWWRVSARGAARRPTRGRARSPCDRRARPAPRGWAPPARHRAALPRMPRASVGARRGRMRTFPGCVRPRRCACPWDGPACRRTRMGA